MPTSDPSTANPKPNQPAPGGAQPPAGDPPKTDPGDGGGGNPDAKFTQADLDAALAKARKEEKDKLYPDLQKAKEAEKAKEKALADAEAARQAEAARAAKLEQELEEIRNSKLSDEEKREARLKRLEEETAAAREAASAAERAALAENQKLRLDLYKERKIREAGVRFVELVGGNTPEEIDASIERVKAQEAELTSQARNQAREEVAAELGAQLPTGSAAADDEAAKTKSTTPTTFSPGQRDEMVRGDWKNTRKKLLEEAKAQAADHPYAQQRRRMG